MNEEDKKVATAVCSFLFLASVLMVTMSMFLGWMACIEGQRNRANIRLKNAISEKIETVSSEDLARLFKELD